MIMNHGQHHGSGREIMQNCSHPTLWPAMFIFIVSLTGCSTGSNAGSPGPASGEQSWLTQIVLESGEGTIALPDKPDPPRILFLLFGRHSFEPGSLTLEKKEEGRWEKIGDKDAIHIGEPLPIALFQELRAVPWSVPDDLYEEGAAYRFRVGRKGGVNGMPDRDEYWDQIIVVDEAAISGKDMSELVDYQIIESGKFAESLPDHIKKLHYTPAEIEKQEEIMTDPVMDLLKASGRQELTWEELESMALPLDYQKILLAGIHDADPGYAYHNGHWFVVWPGIDSSGISSDWQLRKDVWFTPAIRTGKAIIRPAPLSAETGFYQNRQGHFLPMLLIAWSYQSPDGVEKKITQRLFSEEMDGIPQIFVEMELEDPAGEANLLIGHGQRANAFYWGDRSQARTFIPYFTARSELGLENDHTLTDETGSVVLRSSEPVRILHAGISETFIEFGSRHAVVYLSTPQVRTVDLYKPLTEKAFRSAQEKFEKKWDSILAIGASACLPSEEWNSRIDSWLSQISSITRIRLDGKERLSYGSYIYCRYYFGIEEGWSTVAHALWGRQKEAKKQVGIILSDENLNKENHHHQYRNGLSSWYAAIVARLAADREWLKQISPALVTNGYWTIHARTLDEGERSEIGRGLLPSHVYGGDIATPAYSLYSNGTCLKGLIETSDVFRRSALKELQPAAADFSREAVDYQKRLVEVMHQVLDRGSSPPFLPFALEVDHQPGNHEGPFYRITDDELGNYYNLFAPLFLHLGIFRYRDSRLPSEWITDYTEHHGGLFGGLPRFYSGLDAVYAIGNIHEYLERSKADIGQRPKALAALESYMVHASSRNGHTVQEVSGFHPERLDWKEYERVVREALWNFGMYSVESYLHGHSSFTEPLGAGAGEGLWLIRKSLIDEMRDENGLPSGGLFLLPTVPGEWLEEGKEIRLTGFPTVYGRFDLSVKSYVSSKGEIHVHYTCDRNLEKDQSSGKDLAAWYAPDKILIRLVPAPGDRASGKTLKIDKPFTVYDEWTIALPAGEKGDYIIRIL
jgi:hypothetical protein